MLLAEAKGTQRDQVLYFTELETKVCVRSRSRVRQPVSRNLEQLPLEAQACQGHQ